MNKLLQGYRRTTLFLIAGIPFLFGTSAVEMKPAPTTNAEIRQGHAVNYERVKEATSELIRKEMKKNNVIGLSIALVDDQRVAWAQGFGYADENRGIPAAPETIYKIGSITKLFTASAVMRLAEQGKLDIDRPLQTYLPEFSMRSRFPDQKPITLRDLMTHHSGLPANFLKGM